MKMKSSCKWPGCKHCHKYITSELSYITSELSSSTIHCGISGMH